MKRFSIRTKITAVGILTLAVFVGFGAWATVQVLESEVERDVRLQNEGLLQSMADDIADGLDPAAFVLPRGADYSTITIVDADNRLVNATFRDEIGEVVDDPLARQASLDSARGGTGLVQEATTPGGDVLTILSEAPVGLIGGSLDAYTYAIALLVPILIVFGGLALWIAVGLALRPVKRMTDEANGIDSTTSRERLQVPEANDEITHLATTLNSMLDRLDAGLMRQREFVSDASHELRSPLTAIRGASELLVVANDIPADAMPMVAAVQRNARRLELVLDDLTQLADAGTSGARVDVDLDVVVLSEVEAISGDYPAVDIDISAVVPSVVAALEVQLGRAVHNLVVNAARHAASRVDVAASVVDDVVQIIVDDDGPGVPVADRARVFDRFVRLDEGRTRATGGSGLGLALVASIAAAHAGAATCTDGPLGGARFILQFPAIEPSLTVG